MLTTTNAKRTQSFYDTYWPQNLPNHVKTREHVRAIVPDGRYELALDGGSGTGVCSLALSEVAERVVGIDLSHACARTGTGLSQRTGRTNATFSQGSLLELPFPSATFDLVFSWGVIHHTVEPVHALDELVRVLRPGGTLVLAVYLKTSLTVVHEAIRHTCLRTPDSLRAPILRGIADIVRLGERLGHKTNVRDDNPRIESQVEDWFFVPEKHFFTIEEMRRLFVARGLSYEVVCEQTGRLRSSSNFVVRGELAS